MSPKTWIVKDLLKVTTEYLADKNIDNPRLSADVLLAHQLNMNRIQLYLDFDRPLNQQELDGYRSLVRRRLNREPIQYIVSFQEFWSMEFDVNPSVLIPRQESELLVEQVVSIFKNKDKSHVTQPIILDLGTGSGALAISIANEVEDASIWASDISQDALDIANANAKKNHVVDRITFIQGDLWQPFRGKSILFDVIVSNPPYIASEAFDSLAPEVREYEPRIALDGYDGGMFFIEKIIIAGANYLNQCGWLLVEMDPDQTSRAM